MTPPRRAVKISDRRAGTQAAPAAAAPLPPEITLPLPPDLLAKQMTCNGNAAAAVANTRRLVNAWRSDLDGVCPPAAAELDALKREIAGLCSKWNSILAEKNELRANLENDLNRYAALREQIAAAETELAEAQASLSQALELDPADALRLEHRRALLPDRISELTATATDLKKSVLARVAQHGFNLAALIGKIARDARHPDGGARNPEVCSRMARGFYEL